MTQPQRNLALKPLTTFGVAGTAARAWALGSLGELDAVLEAVASEVSASGGGPMPPFVLGGGSNVLLARDLDEPLILVRLPGRRLLDDDGTQVLLEIGAGESGTRSCAGAWRAAGSDWRT